MALMVMYASVLIESCILTVIAILTGAQDPLVFTYIGPIKGTRIFIPDAGMTISAFLGVPYAQPPVEHLRFAPPLKHPGFRSTYVAAKYAPACPQLNVSLYPDVPPVTEQNEDCLYLNIWAPEILMTYRNTPVLVFFEGENFASGSTHQISGHDLAAEGVIVVSVSYRLNVFGFLCMGNSDARGNLGLLDQYLALRWVQENIDKFGGNVNKITVMGHSSGATSVIYHLVSPRTRKLFQRAIIMSGSVTSPIQKKQNTTIIEASFKIAKSLGCYLQDDTRLTIRCLRTKSAYELLNAYGTQYSHGNWSDVFLPVVDSFLPTLEQYLPKNPIEVLQEGSQLKIPILTGIVDYDGVVALARWPALLNDGYFHLHHLFTNSIVPSILTQNGFSNKKAVQEISEILKWYYLRDVEPGDSTNLIDRMSQFYSDSLFRAPHYSQLNLMSNSQKNSDAPIYAYEFSSPGMDVYRRSLNLSGPGHGEELIYLFGKSLARKVLKRVFTTQEEKISTTMQKIWYDFIKNGFIHYKNYDTGGMYWEPYQNRISNRLIFRIPSFPQIESGTVAPRIVEFKEEKLDYSNTHRISLWNDFLPKLYNFSTEHDDSSRCDSIITGLSLRSDQPYRSAMYTLIGLVIVLLALLIICVILLKRTTAERDRTFF